MMGQYPECLMIPCLTIRFRNRVVILHLAAMFVPVAYVFDL